MHGLHKFDANPMTLCIDIGASHVKASVVDHDGKMIGNKGEIETPRPASPSHILNSIVRLAAPLPSYERISVGFPGVVRGGHVLTAPNLGTEMWRGIDLAHAMSRRLRCPARVLNDAEVQGLGVIAGRGLECVLTLGTGIGSAVFRNGGLMPHLELGQHPIRKKDTYDRYLGHAVLASKGRKKWNRRLKRTICIVSTLLNYDMLYLGGGNATEVTLDLPPNVRLVSNENGITGGVRLWEGHFDEMFGGH
jgi:polyphosphate glucokinase